MDTYITMTVFLFSSLLEFVLFSIICCVSIVNYSQKRKMETIWGEPIKLSDSTSDVHTSSSSLEIEEVNETNDENHSESSSKETALCTIKAKLASIPEDIEKAFESISVTDNGLYNSNDDSNTYTILNHNKQYINTEIAEHLIDNSVNLFNGTLEIKTNEANMSDRNDDEINPNTSMDFDRALEELTEKNFLINLPKSTLRELNLAADVDNSFIKVVDICNKMSRVYELDEDSFRDVEVTGENDNDELVAYEAHQDMSSDEEDDLESTFEMAVQSLPQGVVINSNVFLSDVHWHTMVVVDDQLFYCAVCQTHCETHCCQDHVLSQSHILNLAKYGPLKKFDLSIVRRINSILHCGVCNVLFDVNNYEDHENSKTHQGNSLTAINKVSDFIYDSDDRKTSMSNDRNTSSCIRNTSQDRNVSSHDRNISSHDRNILSHDRNILSHDRNISSHDRNISSHDRNILSHDRNISSHDRNILSHDRNISSHDRNTPSLDRNPSNSGINECSPADAELQNYEEFYIDPNAYTDLNEIEEDIEEYNPPCEGVSYASMARRPSTKVPEYYTIDLVTKEVVLKHDSYHMVGKLNSNEFYCMACKKKGHMRFKHKHCATDDHLSTLASCEIVPAFEDYLIRKVDQLCHCGHCNNLLFYHQMEEHINYSHPKKTRNFNEIQLQAMNATDKPRIIIESQKTETDTKTIINRKLELESNESDPMDHSKSEPFSIEPRKIDPNFDIFGDVHLNPFGCQLVIPALNFNLIAFINSDYFCYLCDKMCGDVRIHVEDGEHIQNMQWSPFLVIYQNSLTRAVKDMFHCSICNILATPPAIVTHNLGPAHLNALAQAMGMKKSRRDSQNVETPNENILSNVSPKIEFKIKGEEAHLAPITLYLTEDDPKQYSSKINAEIPECSGQNVQKIDATPGVIARPNSEEQSSATNAKDTNRLKRDQNQPQIENLKQSVNVPSSNQNLLLPGPSSNPGQSWNTGPNLPYPGLNLPNPGPNSPYPRPNSPYPRPNSPYPGPTLPYPGQYLPYPRPNLLNPGQHLPNPAPYLPNPGPNSRPNLLNSGQHLPITVQNLPHPGQYFLNTGQNLPNFGPNFISPGQSVPNTGRNMPSTGQISGSQTSNFKSYNQDPAIIKSTPAMFYSTFPSLPPVNTEKLNNYFLATPLSKTIPKNSPQPQSPKIQNTQIKTKAVDNSTDNSKTGKDNSKSGHDNATSCIDIKTDNTTATRSNSRIDFDNSTPRKDKSRRIIETSTPRKDNSRIGSDNSKCGEDSIEFDSKENLSLDDTGEFEDFDEEEMVFLKYKTAHFKITNMAYNTMMFLDNGIRYCFACAVTVPVEAVPAHIASRKHSDSLRSHRFLDKHGGQLLRQMYINYHCAICNVLMSRKEIKMHLDWALHSESYDETHFVPSKKNRKELKSGLKEYSAEIQKEKIYHNVNETNYRILAAYRFVTDGKLEPQASSNTEADTLNSSQREHKMIVVDNVVTHVPFAHWHGIKSVKDVTACIICQLKLPSKAINDHINTRQHVTALERPFEKAYHPSLIRMIDEKTVNCVTCNLELSSTEHMVLDHLRGRRHGKNIENDV